MLPTIIQEMILEKAGLSEVHSHNSRLIAAKIGVGITTVKRLFGLLSEKENNRKHSSAIIYEVAKFLGFEGIQDMKNHVEKTAIGIPSILSIDISSLKPGMRVKVCFRPRLEVGMTYLGNGEFEVWASKDVDFSEGDRVRLWAKMAS